MVNKNQHLDIVQDKIDIMVHQLKLFRDMFDPLNKKGLLLFWEEKGVMTTQKEYQDKLIECILNHTNFVDMHQSLSGKTIVQKLADEFEMIFDLKEVCARLKNYSYRDHVELHILSKEMFTLYFPSVDQWKAVEKIWKVQVYVAWLNMFKIMKDLLLKN